MDSLLQNITQALGWSMAHSLWQGVLTYGALRFIYLLLPKLASKNKYAFALLGQFILSISFMITFGYYIDVSSTSEKAILHDGGTLLTLSQETPSSLLNTLESLLPWLSSLYVIGLFFQFILFSSSLSKLHYLKTRGLSIIPATWNQSFQDICSKLQIKQSIQFHLSEKISVPLVIGHLKPIILFPIAFVNNLKLEQVESILIHELAHIKRWDYLFNLFKVAMETVLFFNPFIWLLSRHIETEREHACDDVVMKWTPSSIAYAQALMSVEFLKNTSTPVHAMAAVGKKYHLLHRIQRITNMQKNHINARQHLIAVLLCSFALITVAWIAPVETPIAAMEETDIITVIPSTTTYQIPEPSIATDYPPLSSDTIQPPLAPKTKDVTTEREPVKDIEAEAKKIEDYYNAPEWKEKIAQIEMDARKIEEYYNSSEWKNKIANIEIQAKKAEEYFNSPEWAAKIAQIEASTHKIEEYYNSPEWNSKIAEIEAQAKKAGEYFNSPEWKSKISDIEAKAKKMVEDFNSPE